MFSEKFLKAVEMLQKDFALERSIDEKACRTEFCRLFFGSSRKSVERGLDF